MLSNYPPGVTGVVEAAAVAGDTAGDLPLFAGDLVPVLALADLDLGSHLGVPPPWLQAFCLPCALGGNLPCNQESVHLALGGGSYSRSSLTSNLPSRL